MERVSENVVKLRTYNAKKNEKFLDDFFRFAGIMFLSRQNTWIVYQILAQQLFMVSCMIYFINSPK